MAKILLISINDINAGGLRILSAMLKNKGHQAYIVFLKRYCSFTYIGKKAEEDDWVGIDWKGNEFRYSKGPEVSCSEKAILLSLISEINPQLIGFSVTSPLRRRTAEIATLIRSSFKIPIIWGGPEPTISPEDCLAYCDCVCIGEGEKAIVDLAAALDDNGDIKHVNNLAYIAAGRCIRNPMNPLVTDLDDLPCQDVDANNKFLIEDGVLERNFNGTSYYAENYAYHLISSRGCHNNCSYCCEDFYKKLYDKQAYLRRRSVPNVIQELKSAQKSINYKLVRFEDTVFSCNHDWLMEFKDRYKREINLPFVCNIFPNKNIRGQLEILKESGLVSTCLALQSGSARINRDVFNRAFDRALFIETANLLKAMGIDYYVDVITFNPFEKEEDLQATLDVLNELPKPFMLCVNKLYVLKGSKIYDLVENRRKTEKNMVPESLFIYYSHLFWLTIKYNRKTVELVNNARIFKYFPCLFNCAADAKLFFQEILFHFIKQWKRIKLSADKF